MSRSALAVVREAYATAQESLPKYSGPYSRHTFTQWQLFAMLTLRHFMGLDLRSTVQLLCDWSDLREAIELRSIPHYSTLCVAEQRLVKKGVSSPSSTPASDAPAIVA